MNSKEIAMQPLKLRGWAGQCPRCKAAFFDKQSHYCGDCGQKLDWKMTVEQSVSVAGTCGQCKYRRRLIHNFIPGEGWDDNTFCCIVFANDGGPVYETAEDEFCEKFEQKEGQTWTNIQELM